MIINNKNNAWSIQCKNFQCLKDARNVARSSCQARSGKNLAICHASKSKRQAV